MRLAIFIFVCFAASTAVNSTQSNYSGARNEIEKLSATSNDIPRVPSNFSLARRFRQGKVDQPDWCKALDKESINEILANCKDLNSKHVSGFALRIRNVDEETWKTFSKNVISINADVEIINSSVTELSWAVNRLGLYTNYKLIISNNPKLEKIVIKGREGLNLEMGSFLEIEENPVLKSISFEAKQFHGDRLAISENGKLETIEFNVHEFFSLNLYRQYTLKWTISKNPKLHRIQIKSEEINYARPIHIVENEALTQLDFPETVEMFVIGDMYINDNDKLEAIKFPEVRGTKHPDFEVPIRIFKASMLEIRRNDKLKTIDLGEETRWKETTRIIEDNPLVTIKSYTTTTTTTTEEPIRDLYKDRPTYTVDSTAITNGLIALGVIALVLLLCCVGCCVFCCWRRSNRKKTKSEKEMKKKGKGKSKKKEEPPKKEDKSKAEESAKESPSGKASAPSDPI